MLSEGLSPCIRDESLEALVSAENWHEERERLMKLLQAIESGKITHVDEDDLRQLQATNPENIAALKERLAQLNARLGDDET
jgi:predicted nucleotidyltransferase